ncbi:hypothetical protein [Aliarcobacter butzleri]|uniref:hypothetical protein n=1 Tax=Aliarcobacter butzleri TaxID=28197 RepID=UPI00263D7D14|nr:hypothetical protein [Aliarcobacter butzleri]MDN5078787.1 hypothetical protein [Aliarcobacter butzleri]
MAKFIRFLHEKYKYKFFTWNTYVLYSIVYVLIYFGRIWYQESLSVHGDILNGILIIIFGICLLIYALVKNIKITKSFFKGLAFTLLQLFVYAPLSIIGLFALIGILGAASQARPVYRIDD